MVIVNNKKYDFVTNSKLEKKALINEIEIYGNKLDNLFVADNIRIISIREQRKRYNAKIDNLTYTGVNFSTLADRVAEEMDYINGGSWQYDLDEVIALIQDL